MILTIVGCSGSTSGPESPASSYLVQAPYEGRTFSLVVDLGPGAFGALYRYLPDPREVDAYALSHLHPDHCLDLCACYVATRYSGPVQWPVKPVFGPAGTADRITQAYATPVPDGVTAEGGPGFEDAFDFRTWQPSQQIGPFTVTTTRVLHPVEAYAIRITENVLNGGSVVYSGDTGPCDALVDLARGADLLLVESAFMDRPGQSTVLHLNGREAATVGQQAGVGQVVLTHIPPWHDVDEVLAEAVPHFNGPVSLAAPGASWLIGPV